LRPGAAALETSPYSPHGPQAVTAARQLHPLQKLLVPIQFLTLEPKPAGKEKEDSKSPVTQDGKLSSILAAAVMERQCSCHRNSQKLSWSPHAPVRSLSSI